MSDGYRMNTSDTSDTTDERRLTLRKVLAERFDPADERSFTGRGNRTFTFVSDETVMDRLDDAVGLGNWSINVQPMGDRVCRVTLRVRIEGEWIDYEDFGYANRDDSAEPLKEASGDGLRRAARYIGVARYVYAGDVAQTRQDAPQRPQPAAVAPLPEPVRVTAAVRPVEDDDGAWAKEIEPAGQNVPLFAPIQPAQPGERCEEHNLDWRGEPFDLYHRIPNGGYHRHPGNTPRARVR